MEIGTEIQEHMDKVKAIAAKILASTRLPGSFLKLFIEIMWPQDPTQNPWNQMKNKILDAVTDENDKRSAESLASGIETLSAKARDYQRETDQPGKGRAFSAMLACLDNMQDDYVRQANRAAGNVLPLFVLFGTMALSVWREHCMFHKQIYGDDSDSTDRIQDLKDKEEVFIESLNRATNETIRHRQECVQIQDTQSSDVKKVIDTATTGYEWEFNPQHEQDAADLAVQQRRRWCKGSYATQITRFLEAGRLWQFMHLGAKMPKSIPTKEIFCETGPYGTSKPGQKTFDDRLDRQASSAIDKIKIWHDNNSLTGLEVFHNGRTSGLHGRSTGEELTIEIDLSAGERIIGARGVAAPFTSSPNSTPTSTSTGAVQALEFLKSRPARPSEQTTTALVEQWKIPVDRADDEMATRVRDTHPSGIRVSYAIPRIERRREAWVGAAGSEDARARGDADADDLTLFCDVCPEDRNPHWYDGDFDLAGVDMASEGNPTDWVARDYVDGTAEKCEWRLKEGRPTRRLVGVFGEESEDGFVEQVGFVWAYQAWSV